MISPGPRGWQPDAFAAHMRDVVGGLERRDDRRLVLRALLELPDAWTAADGDVTPRVAWTSPHAALGSTALALRSEALGVAGQARLTSLRWLDDAPHPEDLATLRNWMTKQHFLTDALLACGFPRLDATGIRVPVQLWVPRLWLHTLPDGRVEASVALAGDDDPEPVYSEVTRLLAAVQPGQARPEPLHLDARVDAQQLETIGQLIAAMRSGAANKVVWSREVPLPGAWPRSTLAERMRQARPDAWNVDVQLPDGANFLGATPELLVACRADRLTSMALAGTGSRAQLLADDPRLHDEHGRVRDFVENRLKWLGITGIETQTHVSEAGTLSHRRTAIAGMRPRGLDALTAALTLHPTPALLGLPRSDALALLEPLEPPRGLYGGCLGRLACDGSGDGEVVVLLRGVLQRDGRWLARAGAGLVPDSVAADEATEIADKLAAIAASVAPESP